MEFNIRITRREGDVEQSVDIEVGDPIPQQVVSVDRVIRFEPELSPSPPALEWSGTLCNGERVNYAAAEKACAALGEGWRLPTRAELESILDLSRHSPACDPERFPGTQNGWYWTSTPYAASPGCAWFVSFDSGGVDYGHRGNDYAFVRAVRGPAPRQ